MFGRIHKLNHMINDMRISSITSYDSSHELFQYRVVQGVTWIGIIVGDWTRGDQFMFVTNKNLLSSQINL